MTERLTSLGGLPADVQRPAYTPSRHGTGIVHLGLGAFHKAHQAAYTDAALGAEGGDWRIAGVSLRSPVPAAQLTPQNGLYTIIARSAEGSQARVVGSIAQALNLGQDRQAVLGALVSPATKIVTLTVTEKGYGIDRSTGGVDPAHPAIAHDMADPGQPIGVAGLLVRALAQRRDAGVPPFTVLCCDNLPENGTMVRALLLDFARRTAPALVDYIAHEVAFPASMVDRITPASTAATRAAAEAMTGFRDEAAVETEAFSQWVIENRFPQGRPAWEAGGALFVDDVRPHEQMKLRMLNGAHSMLAYAGFLAGHRYVADVMRDTSLAGLVRRHMAAAAATLPPLADVDPGAYAEALARRFESPHLKHETWQIAMDGTEKLPQRILAPAVVALERGQPLAPFAFATAAWMRYALGRTDAGKAHALRDPQEKAIAARLAGVTGPAGIVAALMDLPGLFPEPLWRDPAWREMVTCRLKVMLEQGMARAIAREAGTAPAKMS